MKCHVLFFLPPLISVVNVPHMTFNVLGVAAYDSEDIIYL